MELHPAQREPRFSWRDNGFMIPLEQSAARSPSAADAFALKSLKTESKSFVAMELNLVKKRLPVNYDS
jgi:hypothetical protein